MSEPFKVGDRVVIRAVRNPNCERYVGRTGRIEHVFIVPGLKGTYKVVLDRGFAARIIASAVEAIPERDQRELSTSERTLYATENHDWRDEEAAVEKLHRYGIIDDETLRHELQRINDERSRTSLDRRRTQAAEFARRILGADAELDDLLRLAEWALNEQTERVTFNPGGVIFTPDDAETNRRLAEGLAKSGRIVAEPQEPPRPPDDLEIRDKDGDRVTFSYLGRPHYFVMVQARNTDGDVCSAYVTTEDADRVIAFLQDAKADRNA